MREGLGNTWMNEISSGNEGMNERSSGSAGMNERGFRQYRDQ